MHGASRLSDWNNNLCFSEKSFSLYHIKIRRKETEHEYSRNKPFIVVKSCYCFIRNLISNAALELNYISDEMEHIYVRNDLTFKRLKRGLWKETKW